MITHYALHLYNKNKLQTSLIQQRYLRRQQSKSSSLFFPHLYSFFSSFFLSPLSLVSTATRFMQARQPCNTFHCLYSFLFTFQQILVFFTVQSIIYYTVQFIIYFAVYLNFIAYFSVQFLVQSKFKCVFFFAVLLIVYFIVQFLINFTVQLNVYFSENLKFMFTLLQKFLFLL